MYSPIALLRTQYLNNQHKYYNAYGNLCNVFPDALETKQQYFIYHYNAL